MSGKIQPDRAAELVARIFGVFGDTKPSAVPEKPWLDQKPDPALRSVEYLEFGQADARHSATCQIRGFRRSNDQHRYAGRILHHDLYFEQQDTKSPVL